MNFCFDTSAINQLYDDGDRGAILLDSKPLIAHTLPVSILLKF